MKNDRFSRDQSLDLGESHCLAGMPPALFGAAFSSLPAVGRSAMGGIVNER